MTVKAIRLVSYPKHAKKNGKQQAIITVPSPEQIKQAKIIPK